MYILIAIFYFIYGISNVIYYRNLTYLIDGKAEFLAVFSVTWSFKIHADLVLKKQGATVFAP